MNIKFVIDEGSSIINESFTYDFQSIPRVGEKVIRHVEHDSLDPLTHSYKNKFIVTEVVYVAETREWYLNKLDEFSPILVIVKRELNE